MSEGAARKGRLIGPRSEAKAAQGAALTLLRSLTLGRRPDDDPQRPTHARLLAEPPAIETLSARAQAAHGEGRQSDAALDWLAVSALDGAVPPAVVSWVALNRIRALDPSHLALAFVNAHVAEVDRAIKERPALDRDALLRRLVGMCTQASDCPDELVLELLEHLLRLNRAHAGLALALGIRLLHAGRLEDAAAALERAGQATARPEDRREHLRLLHLYRGATQVGRREAVPARRSFRRALALAPERIEAPLMYAELEAELGDPAQGLNRARALRLLGNVEAALEAGADLRPWLEALVGERCAALRRQLAGARS